jgi:hypothetical protein
MNSFTLELLLHIIGIGSASGLFLKENTLYVVGDNSSYFYEYELKSSDLKRYGLTKNPSENIEKKSKPDFEALAHYGNYVYLFGSGSTQKRTEMVKMNVETKALSPTLNLTALYKRMQSMAGINTENFNIEGVVYTGTAWYFFNRGNGNFGKNIIFTFQGNDLTSNSKITFTELKLPQINGISTSFTDAIIVEDKFYFLAAAENTNSTYHDGEIAGSIIGCIDIKTMKMQFTKEISNSHKFEGLTLKHHTTDELSFLLCEDNDSDQLQADIYLLKLKR